MKFSLINVQRKDNGLVSGTWLQNHVGTLETAYQEAIAIEKANGNKIIVAIVEEIASPVPALSFFTGLHPLNKLKNLPLGLDKSE